MTKEQKQDYTLRITQANETGLVVILYEILLDYLKETRESFGQDGEGYKEPLRKVRAIINELMLSTNRQYEIGENLYKLYCFMVRSLVKAEKNRDEAIIEQIEKLVTSLMDAYRVVAKENPKGPVMGNSQTVYAGLTYGRNTLTENLAEDSGRGMFV